MRIIGRAYIPPLSSRSCNWCRVAKHERPTQKGTSARRHAERRVLPLFDDMSKADSVTFLESATREPRESEREGEREGGGRRKREREEEGEKREGGNGRRSATYQQREQKERARKRCEGTKLVGTLSEFADN